VLITVHVQHHAGVLSVQPCLLRDFVLFRKLAMAVQLVSFKSMTLVL
jgi:hypothetical protein